MPKKVLLIEYEPRYIERIRTLLSPLGHSLTETHDGEAGLQAFASSKFDLVLLSGMLPRLPSAEVIREIRKKGGATAPPIVLMMSGYRGTNRKADAQKVGAFDILVRPFTDDDLMESVRDALDSSDVGAKTMRIDTAQVAAAASPLTSNDIFSDVLSDLTDDVSEKPAAAPPAVPGPASPSSAVPTPAAPAAPPPRAAARRRRREAASRHAVGVEHRVPAGRGAQAGARAAAGRRAAAGPAAPAAAEALVEHRRRPNDLGHSFGSDVPAAEDAGRRDAASRRP